MVGPGAGRIKRGIFRVDAKRRESKRAASHESLHERPPYF